MDKRFDIIENQGERIADIKDYISRILSNWKWFLITIPIALLIAYYVNLSTERIYGLSTTIAVKDNQNPLFSSGTSIAFNWGGVSDKVESIRKAITSRVHNEKVVKELQFYVEYLKEGRFRIEDVYGKTPFKVVLDDNQDQLLNTLINIEIVDDKSFILSVNFKDQEVYRVIDYNNERVKEFLPASNSFSQEFLFGQDINLPFLKLKLVYQDFKVNIKGAKYFIRLLPINQVVGRYRQARANAISGTSLVVVSLSGPNKNRIVDYLNKTVEILAFDKLQEKTNYARSTKDFIDQQFRNASDSLKVIEKDIGIFKQKNDIYNLSSEGSEIFSQTKSLYNQQVELNDRIEYYDNLESYIKTHNSYTEIPAPSIINIDDGSIGGSVSKLTSLSIEKEK